MDDLANSNDTDSCELFDDVNRIASMAQLDTQSPHKSIITYIIKLLKQNPIVKALIFILFAVYFYLMYKIFQYYRNTKLIKDLKYLTQKYFVVFINQFTQSKLRQ